MLFLLSEVVDRWTALSVRGIVVEGIAKRATRGVSRVVVEVKE